MCASPKFKFNRSPQFSVNQLAEYLATTNATQRTKVIASAKFPKKAEVIVYSQIRQNLRDALTKSDFGRGDLEFLVDKLEAKVRQEVGWHRDEAMRCLKAVQAFQVSLQPKAFTQYQISPPPKGLSLHVGGVKINVTLDAAVTATRGGNTNSGGIILLYAFSADRKDITDRLSATSGLILWALEAGQMEPISRLCMTVDLAQQDVIKASSSFTRFRGRVEESCREVAARWDSIEPPHDYDGPAWR